MSGRRRVRDNSLDRAGESPAPSSDEKKAASPVVVSSQRDNSLDREQMIVSQPDSPDGVSEATTASSPGRASKPRASRSKKKSTAAARKKAPRESSSEVIFACGLNEHGQLGLGDTSERHALTAVPALPGGKVVKQVIAGGSHTVILVEDGTLFACGNNSFGQLGLGDHDGRDTFTAVPALPGRRVAKQVTAGGDQTLVLAQDGTVLGCGGNFDGQLGLGDTNTRNTFTAVPALPAGKVAKRVVAGPFHTLLLAKDGTLFSSGSSFNGQLGLGEEDRNTFTAVPALPNGKVPKQVATGNQHTAILTKDRAVFICGWNYYGQLGQSDHFNRWGFSAVPDLPLGKVAKQVISGGQHTMILAEDGALFACGWNCDYGQLGLGDNDDRAVFTAVPALLDGKVAIEQVIAGNSHAVIMADDGTLFACGGNLDGQLGLGDTTNRNAFTAVPALPDGKVAKQVITGGYHTIVRAEAPRVVSSAAVVGPTLFGAIESEGGGHGGGSSGGGRGSGDAAEGGSGGEEGGFWEGGDAAEDGGGGEGVNLWEMI